LINADWDSSLISNELSPIFYRPNRNSIVLSQPKSIDQYIGTCGRGHFEKNSYVGLKAEFVSNLCMIRKLYVKCLIQVDYKVSLITKKVQYTFGIMSRSIRATVITIVNTTESLSKSLHKSLKMLGSEQNISQKLIRLMFHRLGEGTTRRTVVPF